MLEQWRRTAACVQCMLCLGDHGAAYLPPLLLLPSQPGHVSFLGHSNLAPEGEDTKKESWAGGGWLGGGDGGINKITLVFHLGEASCAVVVFLYAYSTPARLINNSGNFDIFPWVYMSSARGVAIVWDCCIVMGKL